MKYLKTWMGRTCGTHLGRDDGHLERKFAAIETWEDLLRSYDKNAEYYALEKVEVGPAVKILQDLERGK